MGLFSFSCNAQEPTDTNVSKESIHQFKLTDLNGETFNMSSLKGKKVMVVNTASKCGLTYQYEILEKMYKDYESDNFIIVGFPANNFLWQEPGSNDEIAAFCKKNYGVSFPLMAKSIVIKKNEQNEVFKWLSSTAINGWNNQEPAWNFCKYLVNEEGTLTNYFPMTVDPLDTSVIEAIEKK